MRNAIIGCAIVAALASPAAAQVTCSGVNGNAYCSDGSYVETIDGTTFGEGPHDPVGFRPEPLPPDPQIGNDKCLVSPSSEGC